MPKYLAIRDTLLSHESRVVKAGEEFETTFPEVNGKAMKLGDNLKLVNSKDAAKAAAEAEAKAKAEAEAAEKEAAEKAAAEAAAEAALADARAAVAKAKASGDAKAIKQAEDALAKLEAPLA